MGLLAQRGTARHVLVLAAVAGALTLGAVGAGAMSRRVTAPPTAVAVVDIEKILADANEGKALASKLDARKRELEEKVKAIVEQGKNEESKLKEMAAGPDKDAQAQKVRELVFRAEFERQYQQAVLKEAETKAYRDMYEKAVASVQQVAMNSGWQLVLLSDVEAKLPPDRVSMEDLRRFISLRRTLHVDGAIDITKEVIDKMNNDYAAGAR